MVDGGGDIGGCVVIGWLVGDATEETRVGWL